MADISTLITKVNEAVRSEEVRDSFDSDTQALFKQFKTITAEDYSASNYRLTTSIDYFSLFAEKELIGQDAVWSNPYEISALTQIDYYKTGANRIKVRAADRTATWWWGRSPIKDDIRCFYGTPANGTAGYDYADSNIHFLSPFGCI